MKCYKCNKEIGKKQESCPYCGADVSIVETITKVVDKAQKTGKVYNESKLIGFLIVFAIVCAFISFVSEYGFVKISINVILIMFRNIVKTLMISGIIGTVVFLIVYLKSNKVLKKLIIISIALIIASFFAGSLQFLNANIAMIDYTKAEYIEIKGEKIPSVYSVLGEKQIAFNDVKKDYMDSGFKTKGDVISIIYKGLTNDEINKYIETLLDYGFTKRIVNTGEKYITLYVKNTGNNFYTVSIDNFTITYFSGVGNFDELLTKNN